MFEVGQPVRYTTNIIGVRQRTVFSKIAKMTARKITLADGSCWTLDGRQWGAGRPRAGWPYDGPRLVAM